MIRIDLTGMFRFFRRLFKRNKREEEVIESHEMHTESQPITRAWPESLTAFEVKDMCESIGVFEAFMVEDQNVIAKVCEDVAILYNSNEKNEANLKMSLVQGFSNNGIQLDNELVRMYIDNFLESYIYGE